MSNTITVIRGDGIGPEIMDATLHVLDAMDVGLQYEFADAGLVALEKHGELLPAATMDSIRRTRVALTDTRVVAESVFVATAARLPDKVRIAVFEVS